MEFNTGTNDTGEYKLEPIQDSMIYIRESKVDYLLRLYYLVSWKDYQKKKNT